MRGIFDQEQLMSPDLLKTATWVLSLALIAVAGLIFLQALGTLFTGKPFTALLQVATGGALPLAIWLIVRQLGEMLLAQHRLNDRLTILTEAIRGGNAPEASEDGPMVAESDVEDVAANEDEPEKAET